LNYNARAVNTYNTAISLVRFESKIIFFYFEKYLWRNMFNAGVVGVSFEVVGLAADILLKI
jgi:hypothetical protein